MSANHRYAAGLPLAVRCAVVGVLAGVVAGCAGGGDDPAPTGATASASASASGTPSSTPPSTTSAPSAASATATTTAVQIPEAARAHTEAGAEAFVKFFVEQSNVASMNADASILPGLTDPSCKSCIALQSKVEDLKSKGHHYASRPVTVTRVAALKGAPEGQQFVRLQMTQNPVDVVDASGAKVSTDPKTQLARTTSLIWAGERWVIFGIAQ